MQTPNILIVEDEIVTRTTLKSLFEAEGYNVFEAENGEEMHDFFENMDKIAKLVDEYNYIAMVSLKVFQTFLILIF